jgi:hypothetical protein
MGKTGLIHITRKITADNPDVFLLDGSKVDAVKVKKTLRWLGVLFDRKLTFKAHVKEAGYHASGVANGLKMLYSRLLQGRPDGLSAQGSQNAGSTRIGLRLDRRCGAR